MLKVDCKLTLRKFQLPEFSEAFTWWLFFFNGQSHNLILKMTFSYHSLYNTANKGLKPNLSWFFSFVWKNLGRIFLLKVDSKDIRIITAQGVIFVSFLTSLDKYLATKERYSRQVKEAPSKSAVRRAICKKLQISRGLIWTLSNICNGAFAKLAHR